MKRALFFTTLFLSAQASIVAAEEEKTILTFASPKNGELD